MKSESFVWIRKYERAGGPRGREGSALIPALLVVSMLGMLGLSLLSAGISGQRVVTTQNDDYRLRSASESAGNLAAENLWSGYLRAQGGAAGSISTFRGYLTALGIADSGPGGTPPAHQGTDLLGVLNLPGLASGGSGLDQARVDELRVVRRDQDDTTHLHLSITASSRRGEDFGNATPPKTVQIVYAVEPATFEGFDYAILTKNVNCVFCHTVIDNAERAYNHDGSLAGTFAKVKVGSLESMMLRRDTRPQISDNDADSVLAGTLYVRGTATNQWGVQVDNWGTHSAQACAFDAQGYLLQDVNGNPIPQHFTPAGDPPGAGANLYLNYPTDYAAMPDGKLPTSFPPPFPDDGGIDPITGNPTSNGAGNSLVDPNEFYAATQEAEGTVGSGTIHVLEDGDHIDNDAAWANATGSGNASSLGTITHGNVILTGTPENPIVIDGTVAIQGDVVIQGYVKGEGTILASGNIYVPGSLMYLDGQAYLDGDLPGSPSGPRTFGVAQDGTTNALGLAAGGNVLLGDFLAPAGGSQAGSFTIVSGSSDGPWNFTLAEISLFNRTEWAHTQPYLPGLGEDHHDPSSWTVPNPSYQGEDYEPRYYQFGPGDEIPIFNLGNSWFDPATASWLGDEVPGEWDPDKLTILNPNDHSNPLLYDQLTGEPVAAVLPTTPLSGWLEDQVYENAVENWKQAQPQGQPIEIDGLLYTNNAIFGMVYRSDRAEGQLVINGSLVCADLGLLAPGVRSPGTSGTSANVPGSPYKVGLRLNYDKRTKEMLNVVNPYSVTIRRVLWSPAGAL